MKKILVIISLFFLLELLCAQIDEPLKVHVARAGHQVIKKTAPAKINEPQKVNKVKLGHQKIKKPIKSIVNKTLDTVKTTTAMVQAQPKKSIRKATVVPAKPVDLITTTTSGAVNDSEASEKELVKPADLVTTVTGVVEKAPEAITQPEGSIVVVEEETPEDKAAFDAAVEAAVVADMAAHPELYDAGSDEEDGEKLAGFGAPQVGLEDAMNALTVVVPGAMIVQDAATAEGVLTGGRAFDEMASRAWQAAKSATGYGEVASKGASVGIEAASLSKLAKASLPMAVLCVGTMLLSAEANQTGHADLVTGAVDVLGGALGAQMAYSSTKGVIDAVKANQKTIAAAREAAAKAAVEAENAAKAASVAAKESKVAAEVAAKIAGKEGATLAEKEAVNATKWAARKAGEKAAEKAAALAAKRAAVLATEGAAKGAMTAFLGADAAIAATGVGIPVAMALLAAGGLAMSAYQIYEDKDAIAHDTDSQAMLTADLTITAAGTAAGIGGASAAAGTAVGVAAGAEAGAIIGAEVAVEGVVLGSAAAEASTGIGIPLAIGTLFVGGCIIGGMLIAAHHEEIEAGTIAGAHTETAKYLGIAKTADAFGGGYTGAVLADTIAATGVGLAVETAVEHQDAFAGKEGKKAQTEAIGYTVAGALAASGVGLPIAGLVAAGVAIETNQDAFRGEKGEQAQTEAIGYTVAGTMTAVFPPLGALAFAGVAIAAHREEIGNWFKSIF